MALVLSLVLSLVTPSMAALTVLLVSSELVVTRGDLFVALFLVALGISSGCFVPTSPNPVHPWMLACHVRFSLSG
jgi:hypothetical protein